MFKKLFCLLAVLAIAGSANAALVAFYNFGMESASTANQGTAGTAADGVLVNGAQVVDIDPGERDYEYALVLNNTTGSLLSDCQYMNITNGDDSWYDTAIPAGGYPGVTFAAWVQEPVATTQGWSMIMSKGYESTFDLGLGTPQGNDVDQAVFSYHNGIKSWSPMKGTVVMRNDTYWYHITAVLGAGEGGACALYVNGVLQESRNTWQAVAANDLDLLIGAEPNRTNYQFGWNGMIDDVRIYDEALDAGSIEDLFNNTYNPIRPTIPEPATIALLGLGGLALLRRRR